MKKTATERNANIAEGLEQGRKLGTLLRAGTSEKRVRMLNELQENAASREADTLARNLATCADATLGDDVAHSESIRAAASGFRDVIVAHPPQNKRGWNEIGKALEQNEPERYVAKTATVPVPAPFRKAQPTPSPDDDRNDDENVRYRYLDEKDGS